jgi:glycine C-acetyltransferase
MGTLGKGLGSFGAYVAASREIISYLVNRARSFIFSTSLPPAVLAASQAALDVVRSEEGSALREKLRHNTDVFRSALRDVGFNTMASATQIVPLFVGEANRTMEFTRLLVEAGIFAQGIRPPTVPAGSCRLRCTVMATHSEQELELAVAAMGSIGRRLGLI